MLRGQLAAGVEVAGLRRDDGDVHHRRLEDQRRDAVAHVVEHALEDLGVVERDRQRQLGDGARVAAAERHAGGHAALAQRLDGRAHRHHHGVVMAVVGALDLQDHVAAGRGARQVHGVHRRLGARVGEAPLRQAVAAHELLRDDDRALRRRGEVRADPGALAHGGGDLRVAVADAHHAEAVVEVDVLVAVDVPHARALAAVEVDRPRVGRLERARHAARHDLAGALEVRVGAGRAGQQLGALDLGQLEDARAIDRLRNSRHARETRPSADGFGGG